MARAHHDAGDHLAAKRALLKALHLAPNDIKIRFNLAFVLQVRFVTLYFAAELQRIF
jgi:Flp pilus assembly protein TadD